MKRTQWGKIHEYLKNHPGATTRDLFIACNVNSPRKRISELNAAGVGIGSYWDEKTDEYGDTVRFKRYYLE